MQTEDFKQLSIEDLISCISSLNRSQVKESWIFQAIVTWCNHDVEARRDYFVELFKMVNLANVEIDYMGKVVLEEKLLTNLPDSYKSALYSYHKLLKDQTSKLVSLGGKYTSCKVKVVHDLSNGSSVNYPDLPQKIRSHCSLTLNGYIYCIGGNSTSAKTPKGIDSVWSLNFKNQTSCWKQVASMNTKRWGMSAAVYGDAIVVAGGGEANSKLLDSTKVYHASFNKWRTISPLKHQRYGHALVCCDGYLYAIGGWRDGKCLSSVERLGDLKEEWINTKPMQTPRAFLAAVNCDGVVYAIGGRAGQDYSTTLKTVEKYDSSTNKWNYVSDMNFKRVHAACVLRNKIYVVGGLDADDKVVTLIDCYDPTCDTWSVVRTITEKLYQHTLVAV